MSFLFPIKITIVNARHSPKPSLPLKFHLFISRIYNLCLLAHIPVGLHMPVRAQRTQLELHKTKETHHTFIIFQ